MKNILNYKVFGDSVWSLALTLMACGLIPPAIGGGLHWHTSGYGEVVALHLRFMACSSVLLLFMPLIMCLIEKLSRDDAPQEMDDF